jgi:PII-like signaling protein
MAFGASSRIHTSRFLDLSMDLPIVVVCVDTEEKIQETLPQLDGMVAGECRADIVRLAAATLQAEGHHSFWCSLQSSLGP